MYKTRSALLVFALCLFLGGRSGTGEDVALRPDQLAVVVDSKAHPWVRMAAEDLQSHLHLVTDVKVPILGPAEIKQSAYRLYVGRKAPGDTTPLAAEEARWVVRNDAAYLYGDPYPRHGVEFAVAAFLEDELGIRWTRPGELGVAFEKRNPLLLRCGRYSWKPEMELRGIRVYARPGRGYPRIKSYVEEYAEFLPSHEEHDRAAHAVRQWQLHMRMGRHTRIQYGHAFTGWWDRFSKTHPDYFALNRWGQREPELRKDPGDQPRAWTARDKASVKVCPSNPKVAEQVVADWVARGMRSPWLNACMNDQVFGFCRCTNCLHLDGRKKGEELGAYLTNLTDRYVYLANAVARLARKHNPEAGAVMYAYETTEQPPRRIRVEPNVCVAIVPTTIDLQKLARLYQGWKDAGASLLLLRPNYPHYYNTLTLPIGAEKQMFEAFQVAREFGAVGADYDSLAGFWPFSGFSDYVLAKAFSDPSKPFSHWENHYMAAFGPAAENVRDYFRYWREELWEKRLLPNLDRIVTTGKVHNFVRGLMWSLGRYYRSADFDATDAILSKAAAKDLSPSQRQKVEELVLANQNARLVFNAVITKGVAKFEHSRRLLNFRKKYRQHPSFARLWLSAFAIESRFGDQTGTKTAERLKSYPLPWIETPLAWQFKLDPEDVGLKEKWYELPWAKLAKWDRLRTDFFWDNPYDTETDPALAAKLKNYDGIGWYGARVRVPGEMHGRRIFLYFGAVDESCWVYVNGRPAGKHLFLKPDDWTTPFEIEIGPYVDFTRPFQTITVRVEDKSGAGGIWKRIWLVSKPYSSGPAGGQRAK